MKILQTPCCNKVYSCRYCHDENEKHHFNRKTVSELICTECETKQKVQADCEKCGVRFGKVRNLRAKSLKNHDKIDFGSALLKPFQYKE